MSDTNESILDLNDILKVALKNDNGQSFNTRWDQTIIALKAQPSEEDLDNFLPSVFQSAQLEHCCLGLKKIVARRMGSPWYAINRRRPTREGPAPACVQTHVQSGGTAEGGKAKVTSCRGTRSSRRGETSSEKHGGRGGLQVEHVSGHHTAR